MLVPVTLNRLNEISLQLCLAQYPYFEELREFFRIMEHTGARSMELLQIERWEHVTGDHYKLQPQKGNNQRDIILDNTFNNFKQSIAHFTNPFLGRSISQALNLYYRVKKNGTIFSGNKEVTFYLFRYRYIRRLLKEGYSTTAIAIMMGYIADSNIQSYIEAPLFEDLPNLPAPPWILIDWSGYFIADLDGTLIQDK